MAMTRSHGGGAPTDAVDGTAHLGHGSSPLGPLGTEAQEAHAAAAKSMGYVDDAPWDVWMMRLILGKF